MSRCAAALPRFFNITLSSFERVTSKLYAALQSHRPAAAMLLQQIASKRSQACVDAPCDTSATLEVELQ